MFRSLVIASFLAALANEAVSETCAEHSDASLVSFLDVTLENNPGSLNIGGWGQTVTFVTKNISACTLTYLKVALIGRNGALQITVQDDAQVFYSGSLPSGLLPGEELFFRTYITDRSQDVILALDKVEIQVSEIRAE